MILQLLAPGLLMGGGTGVVAVVLPLVAWADDYAYVVSISADYPYTVAMVTEVASGY